MRDLENRITMRVVSVHIIKKTTIRIDVLRPHRHAYQSQAKCEDR